MEINIEGFGLQYQTGDHIAVWPTNADVHIDHFLDTFSLSGRRTTVIDVKTLDTSVATVPFPTPTTYETALRYYLEICAPVSPQFVSSLCRYAPNQASKEALKTIAKAAEINRLLLQNAIFYVCGDAAHMAKAV